MRVTKAVNLEQLRTELQAAGMTVRLGSRGNNPATDFEVFTYTAAGAETELPAGAPAVIADHTPAAPPPAPDFGADLPADYPYQIADGVTQLRQYLALPSPTAAQSTTALKLVIRGLFFLLRRAL